MASWRVTRPPHPVMNFGFSAAALTCNAVVPTRWAPSASVGTTRSGRPSSSRAAPLLWIRMRNAFTRSIWVRSSPALSRTSTAAMSAAFSASASPLAIAPASPIGGVTRYSRAGSRGGMAVWLVPILFAWRLILAEWRRSSFIAMQNAAKRLSRFLFQILLPLAERRQAVHPGAMGKSALRGRDVLGFAAPGLLRSRLQGAAIREGEFPGQWSKLVHGVEMRGCVFVRLAAGEERDTRHRAGHAGLEQTHGLLGDFLDRGFLRRFLAGNRHVRLEHDAFERDAVIVEFLERRLECPLTRRIAAIDVVIAIHQDFRLDDRNDLLLLTKRRVARERMRIRLDASIARNAGADVDDGAPLGELGAELAVFDQTLAQAIQAFGDGLAGAEWQWLCAGVDLDARQRTGCRDQLD